MARARNIKPGFFKNEDLAELGAFDRLLFIGLWCMADREGRLENRPKKIKMELFPCDDYNIAAGLAALASKGFIKHYMAAGHAVIAICKFLMHQRPHGTEKDSELPNEDGKFTVNKRTPKNCITGEFTLVDFIQIQVQTELTLDNVIQELDYVLNPDSLNPDSLNPEKGGEKKSAARFDPLTVELPLCVLPDAWKRWVEYRRKARKALTEDSVTTQLRNLTNWHSKGHDPTSIIDYSIGNSYQGLFEPKGQPVRKNGQAPRTGFEDVKYTAGIGADGSF